MPKKKKKIFSQGSCTARNHCECFPDYYGDFCDITSCYGALTNVTDRSEICSNHGECEDFDSCVCDPNYYSDTCFEYIKELVFVDSRRMKYFSLTYYILYDSLPYTMKNKPFNCSLIVVNYVDYFMFNSSECYFEYVTMYGFEITSSLKLVVSQSDTDDEIMFQTGNVTLFILPVTSPDESIPFSVLVHRDSGDNSNHNDISDLSDSQASYVWAYVTFPVFSVFCFLFCFLFCCCLVSISVLVCCSILIFSLLCGVGVVTFSSQDRNLRKFKKLENFDLLYKEQLLLQKSSEENKNRPSFKINEKLFQIDPSQVELLEIIGEGGSFAIVYKVKWENRIAAFKSFRTTSIISDQQDFESFEREANLLSSVNHPGILQFYGCMINPPRIGFLMQFCPNGDIGQFIRKNKIKGTEIEFSEKLRILIEITSAMSYLHARKITHRDLKDANVLLDEKFSAKVMDFGISRMISSTTEAKTSRVGTSYYMAPEIVRGSNYGTKCDVFSFGILMYVLVFVCRNPYVNGKNMKKKSSSKKKKKKKKKEKVGFLQLEEEEEEEENGEEEESKEDESKLKSRGLHEFRVANDPNHRPDTERRVLESSGTRPPHWILELMKNCWDDDPDKRMEFKTINSILNDERKKVTKHFE